ncbi:hypothetical protein [Micromonospora sp. KC213]|uniref:hypothetical protein n=1 Tax=Micromonospora sp. KC213 TaxID=2530378 RepID=UPI001050DFA7|nr:hypothetical protein [Micromonospora sp. KC213]TDC33122.1 hypothetical protein E1166_26080 [Micromonospora sp. KC213]
MTPDEYADRLAEVGAELVVRVRDEGPQDNRTWLHTALPEQADREALLYVLAAAVPDDRPWVDLTAWAGERRLKPHGTQAAAARHRYRREELCDECRDAERVRDKLRKRAQRARARARAATCTTNQSATTTEENRAA